MCLWHTFVKTCFKPSGTTGLCCPLAMQITVISAYIVRRSGLCIRRRKTSGYFLISEYSGYFRFISGYILTSNISGERSSGSQTSLTRLFLPVHPYPVGILLPVWIPFPVRRSYLDLPALVTELPWRRPVLHQDGTAGVGSVSRGAGTEPNSSDRSMRPTLRLRSDSIFTTGNFTQLVTDLEKIEQTAEAMWLSTTMLQA